MKRTAVSLLFLFTFLVSTAWPQAEPQWNHKIITFEAPGAGTGADQGTIGLGNDAQGAIMGYYCGVP